MTLEIVTPFNLKISVYFLSLQDPVGLDIISKFSHSRPLESLSDLGGKGLHLCKAEEVTQFFFFKITWSFEKEKITRIMEASFKNTFFLSSLPLASKELHCISLKVHSLCSWTLLYQ